MYFVCLDNSVTITQNFPHNFEGVPDERALDLSIEKWVFIVRTIENTGIAPHDRGPETCALCRKNAHNEGCFSCPVRKYTGAGQCEHTPYYQYTQAQAYGNTEDALIAARREVILLKKIRDNIKGDSRE